MGWQGHKGLFTCTYEGLLTGLTQSKIGKFLDMNTDQVITMCGCVDPTLHHFESKEKP